MTTLTPPHRNQSRCRGGARSAVLLGVATLLGGCSKLVVLSPAGDVAAQQGRLVMIATAWMLLIIVPVIVATLVFAWRYRQGSPHAEAEYAPDWSHSTKLELMIWAAPLVIIIALGALTWISTHKLDPYRPLDRIAPGKEPHSGIKPLQVQVVSLDWKWLFILPEQGIATVNELAVPVNRPVHFTLTSSTTMNAFYVPDLAGMVYTMPGMQTELHAVINAPGVYQGMSSHYSGEGFSGMRFKLHGLSNEAFADWVAGAQASGTSLTRAAYLTLAQPTSREPVARFASVDTDLYRRVLNLCVQDGQPCMHEVMAMDALRNRSYASGRALQLAAEQAVCRADTSYN